MLQLFVAGHNPRTDRAIATIHRVCEAIANTPYELVVVDVLADPQQAEDWKILVTPTLIKIAPLPQRRIVGDLANAEELQAALSLASPSW